jgi:hypothetical protein
MQYNLPEAIDSKRRNRYKSYRITHTQTPHPIRLIHDQRDKEQHYQF